jgi:hypothetical protein
MVDAGGGVWFISQLSELNQPQTEEMARDENQQHHGMERIFNPSTDRNFKETFF